MERIDNHIPEEQIEFYRIYKDSNGKLVYIEASTGGWTIEYADGTCNFKDEDKPLLDNIQTAYDTAVSNVGNLTEIDIQIDSDCVGCAEILYCYYDDESEQYVCDEELTKTINDMFENDELEWGD
jgi:hypothetical protein